MDAVDGSAGPRRPSDETGEPMPEIAIAGETFNVLVEGDETKPALMISNPLGVNLRLWDPQMPALLEHFRVIRYDSRGHGSSVADEGPYSINRLGADALGILDALGVAKAHWLGLSLGAFVGQWLLVHAPDRIERAVLSNAAAQIPGPELWNERIKATRDAGMRAIADVVAERWFTRKFRELNPEAVERVMAMVRATPLEGYTATCAALRDADLREAIRAIANPVLVIVGRHDASAPAGLGALVANSIKGARLISLDASHISCIEDEANFTKAVVGFLTETPAAAKRSPARAGKTAKRAPAKAARKATGARKTPAAPEPARKSSGKTAAAKKAPVKKGAPVKKAAASKAAAKASAKKAPVKKTAAKKAAAKKSPAKKAAVKTVQKKPVAKKAPPAKGKSSAGKTSAGKSLARKTGPKKAARKTARRRT